MTTDDAYRIKVVFISSHFQPAWDWGGPVRSTWNLIRGLARNGISVEVLTTNSRQHGIVDVPRLRYEEGVKITTFPVVKGGTNQFINRNGLAPLLWVELSKRISSNDIVHIDGFWGPTPLLAGAVCKLHGKPYVISTHGTLEQRSLKEKWVKKAVALQLGTRKLLMDSAKLHYTTKMEQDLSPSWARSFSVVIPNASENRAKGTGAVFRNRINVPEDTILLGLFGRIHPRKGIGFMLDVLSDVSKTANVRLVIVGPEEGEEIHIVKKRIAELNISEFVSMVGMLKGNELDDAYAGVDLLVLPSYGESFGNVVVEAAMQGTPSIVSDCVGVRYWIEQNNMGVVLPLQQRAWIEAISGVNRSEIGRRWHRDALKATANENFSIDAIAKQMIAVYEEAIRTKQVKAGVQPK